MKLSVAGRRNIRKELAYGRVKSSERSYTAIELGHTSSSLELTSESLGILGDYGIS
jgi:hypothetical protein